MGFIVNIMPAGRVKYPLPGSSGRPRTGCCIMEADTMIMIAVSASGLKVFGQSNRRFTPPAMDVSASGLVAVLKWVSLIGWPCSVVVEPLACASGLYLRSLNRLTSQQDSQVCHVGSGRARIENKPMLGQKCVTVKPLKAISNLRSLI